MTARQVAFGVGHAPAASEDAGPRAAAQALERLGDAPARAAVVFAPWRGPRHRDVLRAVRSVAGKVPLVGGTTFGEIVDGRPYDGEVVVALVGGEGVVAASALGRGLARDPAVIAREAAADALVSLGGAPPRLLCVLCDPLLGDMARVVGGVRAAAGAEIPLFGAGTGTGVASETRPISSQFHGETAVGGSIAVLALGGGLRAASVALSGWSARGLVRRVTGVSGTFLTHLDGEPALRVFDAEAAGDLRSREIRPGEGVPAMALRQIPRPGVPGPTLLAIYGTDRDRQALALAVELSVGDEVQLVTIDLDALRAGTVAALEGGLAALGGAPAGVLCADCYGLKVMLQSGVGSELVPLSRALPGVPLAGLYSGGEIGSLGAPGAGGGGVFANYVISLGILGA